MVQTATTFSVRTMGPADIKQVLEVETDAFPTLWPPTPFKRELQNRSARYLVAVETPVSALSVTDDAPNTIDVEPGAIASDGSPRVSPDGGWLKWMGGFRRLLPPVVGMSTSDKIVGYLGLWFIVDDSHIVAVGVRRPHRRHGVGELLMIRSIETSLEWGARAVTLEVRESNQVAHALYEKYGFKRTGVRKRYYMDNHEDAYIMSTDPIGTEEYQREFRRLKSLYGKKWGYPRPLDS